MRDLRIYSDHGDAAIAWKGCVVILDGVSKGELDAGDFLF